ncbi:hypothetical protein [Massilia aerilata]|uniref:Uncharacterized protein n=1 Tax=Massilia aerilata TaxID=453817 RepID=A0ABW0RWJ9_9BURK
MTRANARRTLELFLAPDEAYRNNIHDKIASNKAEIGKEGEARALVLAETLPRLDLLQDSVRAVNQLQKCRAAESGQGNQGIDS